MINLLQIYEFLMNFLKVSSYIYFSIKKKKRKFCRRKEENSMYFSFKHRQPHDPNKGNENPIVGAMKRIVRYESTDELLFDYLKVLTKSQKNFDILDRMIKEKRKHYKILKQIYKMLFHVPIQVDAPTFQIPENFSEGITNILLRKAELVNDYVLLMQRLPSGYASTIYPLLVEEQTQLTLLTYILTEGKNEQGNAD